MASDYLTTMKPAIDAAAEGRLRCDRCGVIVTVLDPDDGKVYGPAFDMLITEGEPFARCREC